MFGARRQVGEVMLAQCLNLILVAQRTLPFDDEIDLLLAVVKDWSAIPVCIQSDFPEARYGLQRSIVFIGLSKDRPVVASWRGKIRLCLSQVGNVAMQPGGIGWPVLSSQEACEQQCRQQQQSAFNLVHEPPWRTRRKARSSAPPAQCRRPDHQARCCQVAGHNREAWGPLSSCGRRPGWTS